MIFEKVQAYTRGIFQGVPIVTRYMQDRVLPLIQGVVNSDEHDTRIIALYQRVFCWMQTLEKLFDPRDFQAVAACNRSIFETTLDLILFIKGSDVYNLERMYWWEQSAKLLAAEALVRYYGEAARPIPHIWQAQVDFIQEKKEVVNQKRLELWPNRDNKPRHPMRWTGAPDLLTDARIADGLQPTEISENLETSLSEFSETAMRRINMTVHGSALALERYLSKEGFYIVSALSYKWSTDLAMFCTKLILTEFGFSSNLPELKNEWAQIKQDRLLIYAENQPDLNADLNLGD